MPKKPKGHWTKEVPTKLGYYKAALQFWSMKKPQPILFLVEEDEEGRFASMPSGDDAVYGLNDEVIKWWWSEPEEVPGLPEGVEESMSFNS